ncbi:MAG: site-specific integrase [Phycisphaerae bacterium]|nr:site-specific integrase [Phycisphaerae bacterium]
MAIIKVGVYRKWLEPAPYDIDGTPIPKKLWPKKRRHNWIVRWVGSDNKKYGKVFKTKKESDRYAMGMQNKVCQGNADKPNKITLHVFRIEHEKIIQGQVSYGTYQEHKRSLELFEKFIGGSIELSKISPRNAEAFVADRLASKKVSVATVNKYVVNLRAIFNRAIDPRGYIAEGKNPFTKIKLRKITDKPKRYVNITEYCKLVDSTDSLWWKTFLSVAYSSGLRLNEILHLTCNDIDFENQRLRVSAKKGKDKIINWEPKSRKNRVVPISDEAIKFLVNLQVDIPDGHPYIFISPQRLEQITHRIKNGKWNERSEVINNIGRDFNVVRNKAAVKKCTIHDLRRSAITNWAQKLPFQVVHKLAGHSNIKTTIDYYLSVRPEDFDSASKVVNEMLELMRL